MKITTNSYDTTLRWVEGDPVRVRSLVTESCGVFTKCFQWTNDVHQGIQVPGAKVSRAPDSDNPSLEITLTEDFLAELIAKAQRHDEVESVIRKPWYR